MDELTPICQMKDLPLGGSTTCRRESLEPQNTCTTHIRTHHNHTSPVILAPYTHATQTTVHASQSPQQPHPQHRVPRQPHRQTKDYYRTTNTTLAHRLSRKSERNLILLQVNINGLKNKLEELIHDIHAYIHHHNSGN